jgi:homoserine O-acetyltransferase
MKYFYHREPLRLESGSELPELTIGYNTYGTLNEQKNNVVWICHALTANSDVADWWKGLVGEGKLLDPGKYFIICANILGSCYGTTGPLSTNPATHQPYYHNFPLITIRDMVTAHVLLRNHLGIDKIHLLIGGSMGGYQALEWCLMEPEHIDQLILIATSAHESPWGIAIHTTQRLAIEADCTWKESNDRAGQKGLKAARAIGMLTYRHYQTYALTQSETDHSKIDHFKASSYISYQGEKLVKRFNAYSYWYLTKSMDSHNLARGRSESIEKALEMIDQRTLVIGINSDILCPLPELKMIADHIPNATFHGIDSDYAHDGFLIETEKITELVSLWLGGF